MKTLRFAFFFLFVSFIAQAQDTLPDFETAYRPAGRFYFGGIVSPDLSWSIISRDQSVSPALKNNGNNDLSQFAITVGFESMYQINQHLALTLGLQYSGKGGKTNRMDYETSVNASDPVSMYYVYDYRYIDIPLRLDVYITRGKISPFITAGVSTNFFINQRTEIGYIDENDNIKETSHSSRSGFSVVSPQVQLGVGVDIALEHSRLRIFPIYRTTITDPTLTNTDGYPGRTDNTAKGKLYSIGLGIGYFLRL